MIAHRVCLIGNFDLHRLHFWQIWFLVFLMAAAIAAVCNILISVRVHVACQCFVLYMIELFINAMCMPGNQQELSFDVTELFSNFSASYNPFTLIFRDAAALVEFLAWLENTIISERRELTEVEVAEVLLEFRAKQSGFLDTSFDTISGTALEALISCCFFRLYWQ